MDDDCVHSTLVQDLHGQWTCANVNCGEAFLPVSAVQMIVEDRLADTGRAFAEAAWTLHTRAVEAYGHGPVADAVAPPEPGEECEEEGHRWNQYGHCERCPATIFLGGTS